MSSRCPHNYELIGNECYSNCPNGTEVLGTSDETCVSTLPCPTGTTADFTGLACTKVAPTGIVAKDTTCPTGYTEWTTDTCYINCTPYFLENGNECRRKIILRKIVAPGWTLPDILMYVGAIFLVIYTLYYITKYFSN